MRVLPIHPFGNLNTNSVFWFSLTIYARALFFTTILKERILKDKDRWIKMRSIPKNQKIPKDFSV